jgi:phospholipase C
MGRMRPTRFVLVVLAVAGVVAGCASSDDDTASGDSHLETAGWDRPVVRPANEGAASRARAGCSFKRGAMPAETLGAEIPVDQSIPIQNIVVLMQENRSFDSYFGHLNKWAHRNDIESAPEGTTNPEQVNTPGSPVHPWQHAPMLCLSDTNHEWGGAHVQWNGGRMDGFFQTNQGYMEDGEPQVNPSALSGERALWWYDERDIPFYYQLASWFGIGDHYFSSLIGPTYPNRDFLYAATSRGVTTNHKPDQTGLGPENDILIFDELEKRGVTWNIYVDSIPRIPRVGAFLGAGFLNRWKGDHIQSMSTFSAQARSGTLPQVAFLDGQITEDVNGDDEHPPADIQTGQRWVSDAVHDLFASPQWKQLALFIAYDEHGGLYDHVPPPPACKPDGLEPVLESREDQAQPGHFDRYGMRVPFMVVSPFAKRSFVSHKTYDHTSITRFIETRFKLPALTSRDANADPLFDFFDFQNPPFMKPPEIIVPTIDQAQLTACRQLFTSQQNNGGGGGGG